MDKKNANPPVGSKRVASVLDAVASPASAAASTDAAAASKAAAAGALAAPAGALEAAAGGGPTLPEWDLYEPVLYIFLPNPYDTCMDDPGNEIPFDMDQLSGSDIGGDEEDEHTKARQVLRRLQVGQYASYFTNGVYKCPFCNRRLGGTDFNCLLTHAEDIGRTSPKVGMTVNVHAFRAKHKALGIHLCNFQRVEIAAGRTTPIKPKVPKIRGQGRKK